MTPQEILDIRAEQVQNWLDNGYITPETLAEIQAIWESTD